VAERESQQSLPSRGGVTGNSHIPLVEEEPHFKTRKSLERQIWSIPTGPETKKDCTGEGRHQFTELDWMLIRELWERKWSEGSDSREEIKYDPEITVLARASSRLMISQSVVRLTLLQ
jgi:hypothetical protein